MVTGLTPRSSAEHVGVAMYPVITYLVWRLQGGVGVAVRRVGSTVGSTC